MKIIGRDAENAKLKSWYKSGKAEFIAIYGRRRVGKTYLVNTFFDNQFTFDATGIIGGTCISNRPHIHSTPDTSSGSPASQPSRL